MSVPGLGDEVQAIKAGLLEIADVLVLNKADLPGADAAERQLHALLHLETPGADASRAGTRPLVRTVASRGEGVAELLDACAAHRAHLAATGEGARRAAARAEHLFHALLREQAASARCARANERDRLARRLRAGEVDAFAAVEAVLAGGWPRRGRGPAENAPPHERQRGRASRRTRSESAPSGSGSVASTR